MPADGLVQQQGERDAEHRLKHDGGERPDARPGGTRPRTAGRSKMERKLSRPDEGEGRAERVVGEEGQPDRLSDRIDHEEERRGHEGHHEEHADRRSDSSSRRACGSVAPPARAGPAANSDARSRDPAAAAAQLSRRMFSRRSCSSSWRPTSRRPWPASCRSASFCTVCARMERPCTMPASGLTPWSSSLPECSSTSARP